MRITFLAGTCCSSGWSHVFDISLFLYSCLISWCICVRCSLSRLSTLMSTCCSLLASYLDAAKVAICCHRLSSIMFSSFLRHSSNCDSSTAARGIRVDNQWCAPQTNCAHSRSISSFGTLRSFNCNTCPVLSISFTWKSEKRDFSTPVKPGKSGLVNSVMPTWFSRRVHFACGCLHGVGNKSRNKSLEQFDLISNSSSTCCGWNVIGRSHCCFLHDPSFDHANCPCYMAENGSYDDLVLVPDLVHVPCPFSINFKSVWPYLKCTEVPQSSAILKIPI